MARVTLGVLEICKCSLEGLELWHSALKDLSISPRSDVISTCTANIVQTTLKGATTVAKYQTVGTQERCAYNFRCDSALQLPCRPRLAHTSFPRM